MASEIPTHPPNVSDEALLPLGEIFERAARDSPGKPFLSSRSVPGEDFTFEAFERACRAVARYLVATGLEPGDRVVLFSENRPRWCVAYAGILQASCVVVPLDATLSAEAVARLAADSGAKAALVSASLEARARAGLPAAFPIASLDEAGAVPWSALDAPEAELPPPRHGDAPAAILYTSGTTGDPKGVVLTHRNLRAELEGLAGALSFRPDDVLLMFLPLQHVLAQVGSFLAAARLRLRVVHANVTRGEELLAVVREEGVTILLAVPLLYHLLHERLMARLTGTGVARRALVRAALAASGSLRDALGVRAGRLLFAPVHRVFGRRLRLMISGGAALDPRVQEDFHRLGFTLAQAYGLTETSGGATFTPLEDIAFGTVGRPLAGTSLRIDRPDAEGVGEVLISGAIVTPGYHGRPRETADVLVDGWLHTGDLGRTDGSGNLVITGRAKDVIVLGSGKNVYPEELEAFLTRSPYVREACVVARRTAAGVEKLHAVIVPDWDRLRSEGIAAARDKIRFELESLGLELPSHLRVLSFELRRDPLPRTPTRKLQRFLVTPSDEAPPEPPPDTPEVAARLASPTGAVVAGILRRRTSAPHLRGSSSLELDLGIDSLNRMEAVLQVEAALGITLGDDEVAALETVDDLVRLAQGRADGSAGAGGGWREVVASAGPADLPAFLRHPRRGLRLALLRGLIALARAVARVAFRFEAQGAERLPAAGAFLLCPNHVSWLDGFLVACALPDPVVRRAFVLGEADYVGGILAPLARLAGIVPTDPNRHLRQAMRVAAAGLREGRVLMLFPEGARSPDGKLQELKLGASILATELSVPIVPVALFGAWEAWPRGCRWPRPHPVRLVFGAPIEPSSILRAGESGEAAWRRVSEELRRALVGIPAPPDR